MPSSPLIQLVAVGQSDEYFIFNPEISYFKYVHKRHTSFAMDSLKLTFDGSLPSMRNDSFQSYRLKIPRHGDLLADAHFVFKLPDIYSNDEVRFQWIPDVSTMFVKKAELFIGSLSVPIDTLYGEWMLIWNELTLPKQKKEAYDMMTGNVEELVTPKKLNPRIVIKSNKIIHSQYPASDISKVGEEPSIKGREVSVPLSFFFTRNPMLYIPLCALQLNEVIIQIETEPCENLYRLYDAELDKFVSPTFYNSTHGTNWRLSNFVKNTPVDGVVNISPYMEIKYVYLNENERRLITLNKRNNKIVIEQLYKKDIDVNSKYAMIELNLNNQVKELIWTIRRKDYLNYNEHTNYTASIPEDRTFGILENAKIVWNKSNDRTEEKDAMYFNMIQPYQHHTNVPKQGIYCYSFALHPEKWQASGQYNPGGEFPIITHLNVSLNTQYNLDYMITVYAKTYNILEITGGLGSIKFSR
jgi:hypothetical protein